MMKRLLRRLRNCPEKAERRADAGYSMMEILIVLAIMAVIATLVGPSLFNQLDKSKVTTARTQIRTLEAALATMRLEIGRFPTETEGLSLLVTPPEDEATRASWRGPYLDDDVPADPWGRPYHYALPQARFEGYSVKPVVFTYGQDDRPGGTGMDADIGRVDELDQPASS